MTAKSRRKTKANTFGLAVVPDSADPDQVVTINFVEDGFTALGNVWYRGQEISILKDSPDWKRTIDPGTGESWMEMDEDEQNERFGIRFFREGKWAGKGYDLDDPELTDEQRAQLAAAVAANEPPKGGAVAKRGPGRPRKTAASPPKM